MSKVLHRMFPTIQVSIVTIDVNTYTYRDDYNSLTSDIFQVILLNVRPLTLYLSNAMYGCPIKSRDNMDIDGFCLIVSKNL